ncbi:hypothetical protein M3T53_01590 [Actinomyces sp. B33]|nr:hypothetical protein [Actinomyces sp. B33]
MARPTNKADLLNAATSRFEALDRLLDSMDSDEASASFAFDVANRGKPTGRGTGMFATSWFICTHGIRCS